MGSPAKKIELPGVKPSLKEPAKDKAQTMIEKALEVTVEAPPIEDTLAKAKAAIAQGKAVKQKQRRTWCCTECGSEGIQLYLPGGQGHFHVEIEDDEPVGYDGNPLGAHELKTMRQAVSRPGNRNKPIKLP